VREAQRKAREEEKELTALLTDREEKSFLLQ